MNAFKKKLANAETVILLNPDHPSASLVEFMGKLGIDAVMIDTEQGSPDVESVEEIARAARVADMCALVRIYSPEPHVIERYMFRGVHGIVVQRVDTAAQARKIVEDVRYCFPESFDEKIIIIQIESALALEELDEFLKTPDVDCFFVGVVDLAKSMGYKERYDHPEMTACIARPSSGSGRPDNGRASWSKSMICHNGARKGSNCSTPTRTISSRWAPVSFGKFPELCSKCHKIPYAKIENASSAQKVTSR